MIMGICPALAKDLRSLAVATLGRSFPPVTYLVPPSDKYRYCTHEQKPTNHVTLSLIQIMCYHDFNNFLIKEIEVKFSMWQL